VHTDLKEDKVKYVWFDFHAECKNMQWVNLSKLVNIVQSQIKDYGYFHAQIEGDDRVKINCTQKGVMRTNCMDCLDRTNVV
jgi:phosphatidylinositol 4-phosphatase